MLCTSLPPSSASGARVVGHRFLCPAATPPALAAPRSARTVGDTRWSARRHDTAPSGTNGAASIGSLLNSPARTKPGLTPRADLGPPPRQDQERAGCDCSSAMRLRCSIGLRSAHRQKRTRPNWPDFDGDRTCWLDPESMQARLKQAMYSTTASASCERRGRRRRMDRRPGERLGDDTPPAARPAPLTASRLAATIATPKPAPGETTARPTRPQLARVDPT